MDITNVFVCVVVVKNKENMNIVCEIKVLIVQNI